MISPFAHIPVWMSEMLMAGEYMLIVARMAGTWVAGASESATFFSGGVLRTNEVSGGVSTVVAWG